MNYMRRALFATYFRKYKNSLILHITSKDKANFKHFYCNLSKNSNFEIDLKIRGISLNVYIKKLEKEYADLCESAKYVTSPRWNELNPIIHILKERQAFVENIKNLTELLKEDDIEIRKLAEEEKLQFESKIRLTDENLVQALFPVNEEDACSAIVLEVQAGVGGQEAMLFAKEMFDMYCNYSEYKGICSEI